MLHVLEASDMNHGVSKKDLKMECFPTEMMSLPLSGLEVITLIKRGKGNFRCGRSGAKFEILKLLSRMWW